MDKFLLLVGKSGSGKDTIAKILADKYGLRQLKSYTTRPRRFTTENTHTFVSELPAETDIVKRIAYTEFNGYEYCATNAQVENSDIYVIDPDGVLYFMEHYCGSKKPVVVYVDIPWRKRFTRMIGRKDGVFEAAKRIVHDHFKFKSLDEIPAMYATTSTSSIRNAAGIAMVLGLEDCYG
jgi:guanylate kinase